MAAAKPLIAHTRGLDPLLDKIFVDEFSPLGGQIGRPGIVIIAVQAPRYTTDITLYLDPEAGWASIKVDRFSNSI